MTDKELIIIQRIVEKTGYLIKDYCRTQNIDDDIMFLAFEYLLKTRRPKMVLENG